MPGLRGSLLDRHGNELAVSEDAATIYATPYQVKNPPLTADKLAPLLGMNADEVLRSLTAELRLLLRRAQGRPGHRGEDRRPEAARESASCPTASAPTRRASSPRR